MNVSVKEHSCDMAHRCFLGSNGDAEHFFTITAPAGIDFKEQINHIETTYTENIRSLGLAPETAVFRRIFLSDALNQTAVVRASCLVKESDGHPVAVSIIQQKPMPNAKIALLAYHVESKSLLKKEHISPRHVLVQKNGLRHLWSSHLCTQNNDASLSSAAQTNSVFSDLTHVLSFYGGDLYHNCMRTWVYVRDIDVFYQGMVDERSKVFQKNGLNRNTHFIASTGIEGQCAHVHDLVVMDAYSILGLKPQQVSYLNDFKMLCAAKDYNVTFERGTRIAYADRAHCFISGTASIDDQGEILYPSDVLKQLDRTLANIEALLRSGKATLEHMMYMIVYLRDPCDFRCVQAALTQRCSSIPVVIVEGAVCRPEWLIEIEGVAVTNNNQSSLPSF